MEKWRDIAEYEGVYQISDAGRVRSKHWGKVRILRPGTRASGHNIVVLCKNSKTSTYLVHRLVAVAFVPNPDDKPCVLHKKSLANGGTNSADNLYWGDQIDNMADSQFDGSARLPRVPVVQMLKDGTIIKTYASVSDASRETGIRQSAISNCLSGACRTSGGFKWKRVDT